MVKLRKGLKYRCPDCGWMYYNMCKCDCGTARPMERIDKIREREQLTGKGEITNAG